MTCCEHKRLSHRYDTTTRTNTGACLVHDCDCKGEKD